MWCSYVCKTAALIALMLLSLAALANPQPASAGRKKLAPQLRQVGRARYAGLACGCIRRVAGGGWPLSG